MIVSGNKNMRANRSEKSSLASSSPRAGRVGRGLRRGAFSIRGHLFSPAPSSIRWRYVFRTMVELVALRRVAPRTAAQHYPLGLRTVSSAAERGAVVAARQPLPLNTYRWRIQGSKTVLLNPLPAKIQPLVRCIDRPTRLADRAYLFEVAVGRGKLLVSGF